MICCWIQSWRGKRTLSLVLCQQNARFFDKHKTWKMATTNWQELRQELGRSLEERGRRDGKPLSISLMYISDNLNAGASRRTLNHRIVKPWGVSTYRNMLGLEVWNIVWHRHFGNVKPLWHLPLGHFEVPFKSIGTSIVQRWNFQTFNRVGLRLLETNT